MLLLCCLSIALSTTPPKLERHTAPKKVTEAILGEYWTPKRDGRIEIFRDGQVFRGRISWGKEKRFDAHNPDPSKRGRPLVGVVFMEHFVFDGRQKFVDGEIYAADRGKTYRGSMWLEDNGDLTIRGYLGIPLFGRSMRFARYDPRQPSLIAQPKKPR